MRVGCDSTTNVIKHTGNPGRASDLTLTAIGLKVKKKHPSVWEGKNLLELPFRSALLCSSIAANNLEVVQCELKQQTKLSRAETSKL